MELLANVGEALAIVTDPARLPWLILGVGLGLLLGVIPGLGGIVGLTILLPLIYGMDPFSGVAMLIGMIAATTASDSYPAVLFGIPGTAAAAATIMDGYPLAKQGQAGRALGAVFFASGMGGIIGAICLTLVIPVARPLVLSMGSPELFMLTLLGISMVGVLSRGSAVKGILAGLLGLLLSTIGPALLGSDVRFTFGSLYLLGGLSLAIVALGIFGVPEVMAISREGRPAGVEVRGYQRRQLFQGIVDVLRHKWILLRSSVLGVFLGIIPGIGGAVVDWILYGSVVQSSRDKSKFGKGDIRGVIAPESASNSNAGGSLIPTLFFGLPGSGNMALLLGAFVLLNVEVGPALMQSPDGQTVVLVSAWTLVVANIVATGVCLLLSIRMAKIREIRPDVLLPVLFIILVVACYQSNHNPYDVLVLLILGGLGALMMYLGWPRAPVLIGFVLGAPCERYLTVSMSRYGFEWMLRPAVLVLAAVITVGLLLAIRMKPSLTEEAARAEVPEPGSRT